MPQADLEWIRRIQGRTMPIAAIASIAAIPAKAGRFWSVWSLGFSWTVMAWLALQACFDATERHARQLHELVRLVTGSATAN